MTSSPWILSDDERVVYDVPVAAADAALVVLHRAGIAARTFGSAAGSLELSGRVHTMRNTAHVGIAVHVAEAARARDLLRGWERETTARVRSHLRQLPGDLLRLTLFAGGAITAAVVADSCFARGDVVAGLAAVAVVLLAALGWWRMRHRRAAGRRRVRGKEGDGPEGRSRVAVRR